ncbi:sensor histidine kinase [Aureimonas psammosilenae]|uniref:sensor histidine kinase n=1 Tax=Aureimonas psammosilenae TaxID=2495496 RepID=UPI001260A9BF|nr:HAMP domain-containing sensor histidine kinase [Aureimonas psammosilenae]
MSAAAQSPYDKTAARRRFDPRRSDIALTLSAARERLRSRTGLLPRFETELLAMHAQSMHTAAAVMPLPLFLTALGLSFLAGTAPAVVWICIAVFGYATLVLTLRRFEKRDAGELDARRWTQLFQAAHFATGIAWAHLASLGCETCGPLRFEIFQFSILFLAIALTAMISWTLQHVVLIAFAPLVAVLVVELAMAPESTTGAMRVMLIGAVPFFAFVSAKIRGNTIERMKHQMEKDELIAELDSARIVSDEARRRAEEANLAKSRFLATMSHELRTPLNAILGFSEVISNEILGPINNESYREYIKDIHASGQHLLNLINEILDLSRVEAGRYDLNEEAVSLTTIAEDCLSYVRLRCENKDIRLTVQMEQGMPQLWADERAVRQIVLNLLSNAVKFTPPGGSVRLRVGWTAGGGQYVSIRDNGPGIPEDEMPIVLSNFGQGSIAIKAAEQGTGLGLPIVKALLHMHNGDFVLTSKVREGTEATAVFPHSRVLEVMPAFGEIA